MTELAVHVRPCLDIIPANSELFHGVHFLHLQNLAYNLQLCRNYYKYIVIDTPSVWNSLTRLLYKRSDLTLVPVTLSALSTRSLRDYLLHVRALAARNPRVRLRIVKNDVFGNADSAARGKAVTMNENRAFLDSLCEQVMRRSASGASLLPQSIIFDLEIPESATVRSAQDAGQTVGEFKQYSAVAKSFDELAKRVQYVLNSAGADELDEKSIQLERQMSYVIRFAAVFIFAIILYVNNAIDDFAAPRPVAPQQLTQDAARCIEFRFGASETLHRLAKHAICRFRAVVPSQEQVSQYADEVVRIHNMTRLSGEPRLTGGYVPPGTMVRFYPPSRIVSEKEKSLIPVYDFFLSMVTDHLAYITGDWCERGTGGGTPHYGIDVAAPEGTDIVTPIDGVAFVKDMADGGRTVGIVRDGTVLAFFHMNKRYVQNGQRVKAGEQIGTVGMTGHTSGPHAHISYGIAAPGDNGVLYGRSRYRWTDPKLFFYREQYLKGLN